MSDKGYRVKEHGCSTKRYCQTLELKDVPELIQEYIMFHSQAYAWPEIREGIRSVGILEMEIYISGNRLFMIVETPLDFDWDVLEIKEGNNIDAIIAGMTEAKAKTGKGKPVCVLLYTEMGNGVDFMMHTHAWHGKAPNDAQLENGLAQNISTLADY
jgi:L-rhamnose mutarotase